MKQKILITSALPYANGPLHFGHIAGAYLPADCYARYQRMKGNDVLYVCGSDEYGAAVTLSAEKAKKPPKEYVDYHHHLAMNFFSQLDFQFDHYSRTTNPYHEELVQQFFNELLKNGYIEKQITEQLYSEKDKRFLADRYVLGTCPKCAFEEARGDECSKCAASFESRDLINPRSKLSQAPLVLKETEHWFFLLDKFKDRLLEWIKVKNWKPQVANLALNYIEEARPRSITRDLNWGIKVPLKDAQGKVFYVWFDAPIGYLSATKEWAEKKGQPELWKEYWCDPDTKLVQFIGKDNIPFHAVFFPAMIMGQDQPYKLVDELPANEFYNLQGKQFSKSDNWIIDLEDFFDHFTSDQIRYAIAANAPESQDSEFTWKDFQMRCNAELLSKFGNLVNRVLVFTKKQAKGVIPPRGELEPTDLQFLEKCKTLTNQIMTNFEHFQLRRACASIMELAQIGNIYFNDKTPWVDAKSENSHGRMNTTLFCCLECLKLLALLFYPIIPKSASRLWEMLGMPVSFTSMSLMECIQESLIAGQELPQPTVLFMKVEDDIIEQQVEKLQGNPIETEIVYTSIKEEVSFDDFTKLDLRVALIIEAGKVEKSNKLLKLKVDLGFETRAIVSGISQFYDPSDLLGKKVILITNLKSVKIMGIVSHGMLLTTSCNDRLEVPFIDDLPPGSVVS